VSDSARSSSDCRRADRWLLLGVFAVALAGRVATMLVRLHRGDIGGGYDASVYYSASAALLHGRMPYDGDFVLLHPPVVMLVGLPFALVGHLTSDFVGYVTGTAAFAGLGALTAPLVAAVVRRHGLSRAAALAAGVLAATWSVGVAATSGMRLEALGDVLLVSALLVLARRVPSRRELVLGGALLGVLLGVKLWWTAPVAVLVLATGVRARRWSAALVPGAVAAAVAAVVLAPFALAGPRMFSDVVTDQLGRSAVQGRPTGGYGRFPTVDRIAHLTGASDLGRRFLGTPEVFASHGVHVLGVVLGVLMVGTVLLALTTPLGRLAAALLATQVVVLLTAPVFFGHYADYGLVAAALVVGAATAAGRVWVRPLVAGTWPIVGVASLVALTTTSAPVVHVDRALLADRAATVRCLVSDSPVRLIQADALDRGLARGCPNVVDVQGIAHAGGPDPSAAIVAGRANDAWRRSIVAYLTSGDAVLLSDPTIRALLGPHRYAELTRGALLVETGPVQIRSVSLPFR
jgi:hypothetical protein